ncbi:MAG: OmpH family outer membrane protein [Planctomycetota bacterium]
MRSKRWSAALAAAALVGAGVWAWSASPQTSAAQPGGATARSNTAVIDLSVVLVGLDEQRAFQTQAQAKLAALQQEQEDRRKEIAAIEQEIRMAGEGAAREEAQNRLLNATINLDAWVRINQAQLQRETKLHTINMYRRITEAAGVVAQEQGFQVVTMTSPLPPVQDLQGLNPQQLAAALQNRKVLWYDPQVDLTQPVVQRMNAQWQAP